MYTRNHNRPGSRTASKSPLSAPNIEPGTGGHVRRALPMSSLHDMNSDCSEAPAAHHPLVSGCHVSRRLDVRPKIGTDFIGRCRPAPMAHVLRRSYDSISMYSGMHTVLDQASVDCNGVTNSRYISSETPKKLSILSTNWSKITQRRLYHD